MGSMDRFKLLPALFTLASIAAACAPLQAQAVQQVSSDAPKVKEIHPIVRPMPFAPVDEGQTHAIEFRKAEQMTQMDLDLLADARPSIAEHAGHADLGFNQGNWSYRQMVCPALPNHLFVRFMRNNGAGDVSVFSASIPRDGRGRVRIVPIQFRGYSLFSPAPTNAVTVSAFNHIRAEEHAGVKVDWLGTAFCYAALAGGNPRLPLAKETQSSTKHDLAMPVVLEIPAEGGAVIRFTDLSAVPRPMAWTMIFDAKDTLLKVEHLSADIASEKALNPKPVDSERALNPAPVDIAGRPLTQTYPITRPLPAQ